MVGPPPEPEDVPVVATEPAPPPEPIKPEEISVPTLVSKDAPVAEALESASALRAARWRDKKKQENPEFNKKEAERKKDEREEAKWAPEVAAAQNSLRIAAIKGEANKIPGRSSPVLNHGTDGERLKVTNESGKKVLLEVGGYGSAELERKTKPESHRVTPKGYGSKAIEETKKLPQEFEDSFAQMFARFHRPKEVQVMQSFVRQNTRVSPMMVCLLCEKQIYHELEFGAGFNHFHDEHPKEFERMMEQVKRAAKCPEDHTGMARRHGKGTEKLYCGRCRKLLYKPPRKQRSDTAIEPEIKAENAA
jgi:hypothetical protein